MNLFGINTAADCVATLWSTRVALTLFVSYISRMFELRLALTSVSVAALSMIGGRWSRGYKSFGVSDPRQQISTFVYVQSLPSTPPGPQNTEP